MVMDRVTVRIRVRVRALVNYEVRLRVRDRVGFKENARQYKTRQTRHDKQDTTR